MVSFLSPLNYFRLTLFILRILVEESTTVPSDNGVVSAEPQGQEAAVESSEQQPDVADLKAKVAAAAPVEQQVNGNGEIPAASVNGVNGDAPAAEEASSVPDVAAV